MVPQMPMIPGPLGGLIQAAQDAANAPPPPSWGDVLAQTPTQVSASSAQTIAEHLAAHPAVSKVHYPGLPGHPQAALAKKQMREAGTVVSFDLKEGGEAARRFSERLKLFALTASLGSTESLVMAPQLIGTRDFTPEQARQSGIAAGTVRLSVGLEDVGDLVADIDQALS
jgi:cystathionine beta-lyase/cystathionine gamma-synthase